MSELTQKLAARVNDLIAPHIDIYGIETPVVRMALQVVAIANEIDEEISLQKIATDRAVELTGWSAATLQRHARAKIAGDVMPDAWGGLIVERVAGDYLFVLGTIPEKLQKAG